MLLRGAVAGLLLFHIAHLLWPAPRRIVRFALAAFTASVLAYVFCSLPPSVGELPAALRWPLLALCTSSAPLLWLAARALFDDGFAFSVPLFALLLAVMLAGVAAYASPDRWPGVHGVAMAGFVAAALWEIGRGWRADLVEPRRAARRWVALGVGIYIAVVLMVEAWLRDRPAGPLLPVLHLAGIGAVALALAVAVARRSLDELLGSTAPPVQLPAAAPPSPANARLLARLTQAMTEEHVYRREGLTLAALAETLGCSETALRGLINQGLGYRNFNDFLHHYRLEEAAARLRRDDLPILTIALECGYGSIGPFNRAFKQRFGMTPTEHRATARIGAAGAAAARATR